MMLLFIFSVQLSVEHLIYPRGLQTQSTLDQFPVYFYLITGRNLIVSIGQFILSVHYATERG